MVAVIFGNCGSIIVVVVIVVVDFAGVWSLDIIPNSAVVVAVVVVMLVFVIIRVVMVVPMKKCGNNFYG